jgi:ligand-binding SRPBCC domain-containing protein
MLLEFSQRLPVPREGLFAFHADPENLKLLLDGWPHTEVLTTDGHIRPGARLSVQERFGPFRMRFDFEHFLFEPPQRFGERMVGGLFLRFQPVHEFEEPEGRSGETLLRERVTFELPWWLGGALGTRWFAARRLRGLFAHRQRAYARLCEEGWFST